MTIDYPDKHTFTNICKNMYTKYALLWMYAYSLWLLYMCTYVSMDSVYIY